MLDVLADDVVPSYACCAVRLSPVDRWRVELLDYSGWVVIRPLQDVTKSAKTALSHGAEDAWLTGPSTEFLIGHMIAPGHSPKARDSTKTNAGGEDLAERPRTGTV